MPLETIACCVCEGTDSTLWGEENGFQAVKCTQCGFVYVNPRPSMDDIDDAVRTGMHTAEDKTWSVVNAYNPERVRRTRDEIAALFPELTTATAPIRWLDVGAGHGELVDAVGMLVPDGSTVLGLEPCLPKVEAATRRGLRVERKDIEEVDTDFDYVSLSNVFSHLPDPVSFVDRLRSRMRPGSHLYLVTGNAADIPREDYPGELNLPDHLCFTGESHLVRVLEMCEFSVVDVHRYPVPRAPIPWIKHVRYEIKRHIKKMIGRRPVPMKRKRRPAFRDLCVRATLR